MSFSSERQSSERSISLKSDEEIRAATQVEFDRLSKLQNEGRLTATGAELLEALQRDCLVHDF